MWMSTPATQVTSTWYFTIGRPWGPLCGPAAGVYGVTVQPSAVVDACAVPVTPSGSEG